MLKTVLWSLPFLFLAACSSDSSTTRLGRSGTALAAADKAIASSGQTFETNFSYVADLRADACPGFGTGLPTWDNTIESVGCQLTANSRSPETARGAFDLVNEIMRGVESRVTLALDSTATIHENLSFTVTTSDGPFNVVASVSEQSLSSVWDYAVEICLLSLNGQTLNNSISDCGGGNFSFSIFFKDTNNQIAFKSVSRISAPEYEVVLFNLDINAGKMQFEVWATGENKFHTRYLVEGTYSSTYNLDDVTNVYFAHARADNTVTNWSAIYATFDGTNLCANYHNQGTGVGGVDGTIQGACGHPDYDAEFHNFLGGTNNTDLMNYADDPTKGLLTLTTSTFDVTTFNLAL